MNKIATLTTTLWEKCISALIKIHGLFSVIPVASLAVVSASVGVLVIIASIYQTVGQCHHFK